MTYITGNEYIAIADKISDARVALLGSVSDIFDAVYEIVQYDNIEKELDLLAPFYNVYQVSYSNYSAATTLNAGIRALNNHVLKRSSFDTMDEFLSDQGVQVTQAFADMCNKLGYGISESYIV
tara:strand:- start:1796 stop:2164 length:369 start_codon:yes stop_codon:yes gene_type:complete